MDCHVDFGIRGFPWVCLGFCCLGLLPKSELFESKGRSFVAMMIAGVFSSTHFTSRPLFDCCLEFASEACVRRCSCAALQKMRAARRWSCRQGSTIICRCERLIEEFVRCLQKAKFSGSPNTASQLMTYTTDAGKCNKGSAERVPRLPEKRSFWALRVERLVQAGQTLASLCTV